MTNQELLIQLQALQAENAKLKAQQAKANTQIRVSEAGYVEVYGIKSKGRFSIAISPEGWDQVFTMQEEIKAFAKANKAMSEAKLNAYYASKAQAKAVG